MVMLGHSKVPGSLAVSFEITSLVYYGAALSRGVLLYM